MKKIEFLLIQLDGFLYTNYPEVRRFFNDPVINLMIFKDDSLIKLYEWKNGSQINLIDKIRTYELCSFGYFLPYNEALYYQEQFIKEEYFSKKAFFPIIASLSGDFLLIETNKKKSKVYLYSPNLIINEPEVVFESIESMIETVYECFIQKAYTYDNNNYLKIDFDLEKNIALKLNGKINFWKE